MKSIVLQCTFDIIRIFCKGICAKLAEMTAKYHNFTQNNFGMYAVVIVAVCENIFVKNIFAGSMDAESRNPCSSQKRKTEREI